MQAAEICVNPPNVSAASACTYGCADHSGNVPTDELSAFVSGRKLECIGVLSPVLPDSSALDSRNAADLPFFFFLLLPVCCLDY